MENRDNGHMESMELARLQQEIRSLQGRISETSKNLEDAEIQRDTYRKEVFFLKNRIETLESNGEPQGRGEVNPGGQRVSILVDVHNMYTSAKSIHQAKLSYQRLIKTASGGRPLNRAIAYVIGRGGASQESFLEILRNEGYEVKVRAFVEGANGVRKGDWYLGIGIDALTLADRVDVITLVSGDPEFIPLIEVLKVKGVRVEVIAFKETTPESVVKAATQFHPLTKEDLY